MTTELANRLAAVKPSPSMAAKALVDALRAGGRTIIDFTIGEPDFPTPPHVVAAGTHALTAGLTRYTPAAGTLQVREAIARKLARENGLPVNADQITVGCGAKHVIYNALAATVNEGDEVIIPAPYWVSYPDMVILQGGVPVIVACDEQTGFKLTPQALEASITARTRWLILNSPNNPTGAVYSIDELSALAAVILRHPHVWVLTDEIYEHFVYGGKQHFSILAVEPRLKEQALVINGLSKTYAMTGWRIGYGAGPRPLVGAITSFMSQSVSCASSVSQVAAIAALDGPQECVTQAVACYEDRRDRMVTLLAGIPGIRCPLPDGAFYVFVSVEGLVGARTASGKSLENEVDINQYFLAEAGVAMIDGSSYGMPGYLRLSFATSMENIEAGCRGMARAVSALKRRQE